MIEEWCETLHHLDDLETNKEDGTGASFNFSVLLKVILLITFFVTSWRRRKGA
jgi:hypothetical protein